MLLSKLAYYYCYAFASIHIEAFHVFVVPSAPVSVPSIKKQNVESALVTRASKRDHHEPTTVDYPIEPEPENDTIRVRIWRALASGEELTMTQLCKQVGERNRGDVRSHLTHVERQAKTIMNKSDEWRIRRGLLPVGETNDDGDGGSAVAGAKKLRLKMRKGTKNELFIRLV